MSDDQADTQHVPTPSLWPIGFAIGVACVLVGLVVSVPALIVGAVITLVFGFLWVRDLLRAHPAYVGGPGPRSQPSRRRRTSERTSIGRRSPRSRRSASAA